MIRMIHDLSQWLASAMHLSPATHGFWITLILRVTLVAVVFLGGISLLAMFTIWLERKLAGHMQSRLGPVHTGGKFGWAQSIADGLKLLAKEDLMPAGADALLFKMAPYMAFVPVFAAFLALPFGPQFIFEAGLNVGVLYLLAVLSVEVMGVILAGWASNNKWSIYGAMREACQMVSYEVPLGLSILTAVLVAGTLQLTELGYLQSGGLQDWFVFHNPFLFIGFVLYFVASLASNKRAPFDLPESESELVAGFHTEYSGMRFSFFFFAEYAAMFVVGGIQAALFLGGWASPLGPADPIYHALGFDVIAAASGYFSGAVDQAQGWSATASAMGFASGTTGSQAGGVFGPAGLSLFLLNAYCLVWFVIKAMAIVFIQIWLRWTLPRIRIDQVLHTCVKVLLPMSLVTLLGCAVWMVVVPQAPGVMIGGQTVARLGHLFSPTPMVQLVTQCILMGLGLLVVLSGLGVIVWAWIAARGTGRPPKSFFTDVMPVGKTVAFTKSK